MASLCIDIVTDARALADLAPDWERLLALTPMGSGFQSAPWVASCRAALPDGADLFTLVARRGAEIVGILPTELRRGGELHLVGDAVSNYAGPVYRPEHVDDVVAACGELLRTNRRVRLVDFRGLREGSPFLTAFNRLELRGWSAPTELETATCPLLDLSPGWEAIYARRKGKQRANFNRKWASLERLGALAFVEITDGPDAAARLPALFTLFASRWQARHESGGFAGRYRGFHERAIRVLADAGHLRLSLLELDGVVVAFSYGVAGDGGTSSYVLGHDDRLNVCSPGALLLLRILEQASRRGDREYDFSLGLESYKDQWATGARRVLRVLRWRYGGRAALTGRLRRMTARAWVAARSIDWLRDLRREGIGSVLGSRAATAPLPDRPGWPAGNGARWYVYRIRTDTTPPPAPPCPPWTYRQMQERLSPRLLELAVDRSFRGDLLIVLGRDGHEIGIAWKATAGRRPLVTGHADIPAAAPVYYHPIPAEGVDRTQMLGALLDLGEGAEIVLVTADPLPGREACLVQSFATDARFSPPAPTEPKTPAVTR